MDEAKAQGGVFSILDGISDPFVVLDRDGSITFANRAAVTLARTGRAQLIGHRFSMVAGFSQSPATHAACERAMRTREPGVVEDYNPAVDRWYESSIYPIDEGLSICTRDITVKKHAFELTSRLARHSALRADVSAALADERELRPMLVRCCEALVDQLEVAFARIWTVDDDDANLLLQASSGMYTHIDGPHAVVPIGKYKIGLIASERQPHLTNDVANDPRIGNPEWAAREKMVSFAGYPLMVDSQLVGVMAMFAKRPLPGDVMAALAGISDTIAQGLERRRAEIELEQRVAELARSNSELEQFAYVASHDLQEPLRMVASYNQLLARRYQGKLGPDADEFISYTVEGVQRMQRLINDLLSYSRVGTRALERGPIAMDKVLEVALANLTASIEEHHATVTHDPLPAVQGNEGQLVQLLQNLIGNAIKFHGAAAPAIHVSVRRDPQVWAFSIADNGIGIDPQYFERIFVIFQRLHAREKYPGTGIGLAISKKIVERHGGRIWVDSVPEQGSTVWFTLPPAEPVRRTP